MKLRNWQINIGIFFVAIIGVFFMYLTLPNVFIYVNQIQSGVPGMVGELTGYLLGFILFLYFACFIPIVALINNWTKKK